MISWMHARSYLVHPVNLSIKQAKRNLGPCNFRVCRDSISCRLLFPIGNVDDALLDSVSQTQRFKNKFESVFCADLTL